MKISVKVKLHAKEAKVEQLKENEFMLWVNTPAKVGKANAQSIDLLSEYFNLPKTRIRIIKGQRARNKIFEVG